MTHSKVTFDKEKERIYIYLSQAAENAIVDHSLPIDFGVKLDIDQYDKPVGFDIVLDDPFHNVPEVMGKYFGPR